MQIEEYFDFRCRDDSRLRGHRIGIETVLDGYLHHEMTAEQIQEAYPSLTLEEVYATILYYFRNRDQVTEYMANWIRYYDEAEATIPRDQPPTQRLRAIKAELEAYPPEERPTMARKVAGDYDTRQRKAGPIGQEVT